MKVKYYIIFSVITVAVVLRILLPYVALHYINNQLNRDPNYSGKVANLNISILTASVTLKKIEVNAKNYPQKTLIFQADSMNISAKFLPILKRKIVIDMKVNGPKFNYIIDKTVSPKINHIPNSNDRIINIELNKVEINSGQINIINLKGKSHFNIEINNIQVLFKKLSNTSIYAISANATVMNSGKFNLEGKLIPFKREPYFDINSKLTSLDITRLNEVIKHYSDIKVTQGTFSVFLEASVKNKVISGYIKPFIKDLAVEETNNANVVSKIYKNAIEIGKKILKNPDQDTVATKIKIYGNVEDPDVNNFSIISYLIQHAFVQALIPGIDSQYSFQDINYNKKSNKKAPVYLPLK